MSDEKRKGADPIPEKLEDWLTNDQVEAIKHIEELGWQLRFIRREGLDHPVPVVYRIDGSNIGVLDEEGKIDMNPHITVRKD